MRTKETAPARLMCAIFLTPIIALGLIFLILWLGLRPHAPKFHIHEFSVPGLSLGQPNGFQNASVSFNVSARNPNRRVRILYESLDGSVYYRDYQVGSVPLLNSFKQDPKNTTTLRYELSGAMMMSTVSNQSWAEFTNDRARGTVIFRLQFKSVIQYQKSMWDLRHHRMHANCDVGVGSDGLILPNFRGKKCRTSLS